MPKYLNLLVKNIQFVIDVHGENPAWLSRITGIAPGTISKLLKKEHSPNLETLEQIESGLGLKPGELLSDGPNLLYLATERRNQLADEANATVDLIDKLELEPEKNAESIRDLNIKAGQISREFMKLTRLIDGKRADPASDILDRYMADKFKSKKEELLALVPRIPNAALDSILSMVRAAVAAAADDSESPSRKSR